MPQKLKFLFIGFINTIFGYFCGIAMYLMLYEAIGVILVGIFSNMITISFSFVNYKLFVFDDSDGSWLIQYLISFVTYFFTGLFGVFVLWVCIEKISLNIYFSQAIVLIVSIPVMFLLHKKFTFN